MMSHCHSYSQEGQQEEACFASIAKVLVLFLLLDLISFVFGSRRLSRLNMCSCSKEIHYLLYSSLQFEASLLYQISNVIVRLGCSVARARCHHRGEVFMCSR